MDDVATGTGARVGKANAAVPRDRHARAVAAARRCDRLEPGGVRLAWGARHHGDCHLTRRAGGGRPLMRTEHGEAWRGNPKRRSASARISPFTSSDVWDKKQRDANETPTVFVA